MRPNFCYKNPLFWFFKLSVFLGSFSIASIAFANTTGDPQEGYHWEINGQYPSASADQACSAYASVAVANYVSSYTVRSNTYNSNRDCMYRYTMANGNLSNPNYLGNVAFVAGDPPSCDFDQPPQTFEVVIDTVDTAQNGKLDKVTNGLCVWAMAATNEFEVKQGVDSGKLYFSAEYIPYAESSDAEEGTYNIDAAPPVPDTSTQELTASSGLTDSTVETVTPVSDQTFPDGTVVETDLTTTETTLGAGVKVEESPSVVTVTDGDGIKRTETYSLVTTTHPDGSQTVEAVRNVVYEQTETTVTNIDKETAALSVNTIPSSQSGTSTTTTTTKDAGGNVTGSTTTKTGLGTGGVPGSGGTQEQQKEAADFCVDNPQSPDCAEAVNGTFGDTSSASDLFASFMNKIESGGLYAGLSGVFSDSSMPSGVCPIYTFSLFESTQTLDWHCTLYQDVESVISSVFIAGWVILGAIIVFSA